jgi:maltose alpha-D-glucosyltransferase/alpha-amylase
LEQLYLPIDESEDAPNVEDQQNQEDSLLNTVRNLIRLRKQNPALQASGDFIPIYAEEGRYPFVYFRSAGKNKVLIAVNPSSRSATASFKLPTAETFVELKMVEGIRLRENKGVFNIKMDGLSYGIFSC